MIFLSGYLILALGLSALVFHTANSRAEVKREFGEIKSALALRPWLVPVVIFMMPPVAILALFSRKKRT